MSQKKGPFESSIALCKWAMRYGYEQYDMTPAARLAGGAAIGSGLGLYGTAGAAQSGMVLCEVEALRDISKAIVVATCAPRSIGCKCGARCCRGYQENRMWRESVEIIGAIALEMVGVDISNIDLRRMSVEKHFGVKHKFTDIASEARVDRKTASNHFKRISNCLRAVEYEVWVEFDELLRGKGMIAPDAG